jgi:UDP-2-acetamido-2-deoxy-ribo-hexuluronate aminotransferase
VQVREESLPSRHLYVVHAERRDDLRAFLAARGVQTGLHYPLPLHLQECYRPLGMSAGAFPGAEWSAARALSLPIFPGMAPAQIAAVIRGVEEFVSAC